MLPQSVVLGLCSVRNQQRRQASVEEEVVVVVLLLSSGVHQLRARPGGPSCLERAPHRKLRKHLPPTLPALVVVVPLLVASAWERLRAGR